MNNTGPLFNMGTPLTLSCKLHVRNLVTVEELDTLFVANMALLTGGKGQYIRRSFLGSIVL